MSYLNRTSFDGFSFDKYFRDFSQSKKTFMNGKGYSKLFIVVVVAVVDD